MTGTTVMCQEPKDLTLADVLKVENKGKFYTVFNEYSKKSFIVTLVHIGQGDVIPIGTDGTIFGGGNDYTGSLLEFWSKFSVTEGWNTYLSLKVNKDALL